MPDQSLIVKLPLPASWPRSLSPSKQQRNAPCSALSTQAQKPSSPTKICPHFTQSQLSFALTVTKSKPPSLSTAEYIKQLQKHQRAGQPVPKERLRYIETVDFWKHQYETIYKEKKHLEDKVRCLEEANRLLKGKLRGDGSADEGPSATPDSQYSEEGQNGRPQSEAGTTRKRAAPSMETEAWDNRGEINTLSAMENDDQLRLSSYALRILQQRGRLQAAAQDCSTLDQINNLTEIIIQTISLLEESIPNCCLPLKNIRIDSHGTRTSFLLRQVFHQVDMSLIRCLNSVDELFLTIPGRSKKSEVVYRLVMLFKKSLDFLHTISGLQAEDEAAHRSPDRRSKRARAGTAQYTVNKCLAQTLITMVQGVDWKADKTGHAEILEGILFLILDQTGRLLSDSVFGEHVSTSDNPGNITKRSDELGHGGSRPESQYIIQILNGVLGGSERIELVSRILTSGRTQSCGIGLNSLSGAMLSKSKKLLQSTLLKSMLGGVELESLKLPRPPTESSSLPADVTCVEKYGKEWLLETVWGLVGWDLMT